MKERIKSTWRFLAWVLVTLYNFLTGAFSAISTSLSIENFADPKNRVVVITGCDSGIGHALALACHSWGFTVLATCVNLDSPGALSLRNLGDERMVVANLDLRSDFEHWGLLEVVQELEDRGHYIWCLVNNAGVMTYAMFEWMQPQHVKAQLEVNIMGTLLVTRALLPRLRRSKGRIVNVSSPQGLLASPNMAVYCASKWGLEGFVHALRREVTHQNVNISIVRPCQLPHRTNILRTNANQLREMKESLDTEGAELYGDVLTGLIDGFGQAYPPVHLLDHFPDPHLYDAFKSAIRSKRPKMEYTAAPFHVSLLLRLMNVLPSLIVDWAVGCNLHIAIVKMAGEY
ncbi:D-beta-hydroxybutyrate dehydrogenase, mitochondrial-like [Oratosquilla oratoria]|uniref:D-beta-hydroxybutyrate dehydrogenase, mitochondrial-like n=1 Tax=Oratosquilla oratoria TaxID=337810 RepID=UPI003F7776A8